MRPALAAALRGGFNYTSLDKMVAQFDFNQCAALDTTLSTNSLASLADLKGIGYQTAAQGTKLLMPTYTASDANMGYNASATSPIAGHMDSAVSNLDIQTAWGGCWFGAVIRTPASATGQKRVFGSVSLSAVGNFVFRLQGTTTKMVWIIVDNTGTRTLTGGTTMATSTNYLIECEVVGRNMNVYLNGKLDGTLATLVPYPTQHALQLFNKGSNATEGFTGSMARLDLCRAMPNSIHAYRRVSANLYNIPGVLP